MIANRIIVVQVTLGPEVAVADVRHIKQTLHNAAMEVTQKHKSRDVMSAIRLDEIPEPATRKRKKS